MIKSLRIPGRHLPEMGQVLVFRAALRERTVRRPMRIGRIIVDYIMAGLGAHSMLTTVLLRPSVDDFIDLSSPRNNL